MCNSSSIRSICAVAKVTGKMSDIDMDMHGITPDFGHGGSVSDEEVGFSNKEHDLYENEEVAVRTSNSHLLWSNVFCLLSSVALLATSVIFMVNRPMETVLRVSGITPIFLVVLSGFMIFNAVFGLLLWNRSFSVSTVDRSAYTRLRDGETNSDNGDEQSVSNANFCAFPITIHYISNVISVLLCLIFMIATVVSYGNLNQTDVMSLTTTAKIFRWSLVVMILVNILSLCFAIYGDLSLKWGRRKTVAWSFMVTLCLFIFIVGACMFALNEIHGTRKIRWVFLGYQSTGGVLLLASICGILTIFFQPSMTLDICVVLYTTLMYLAFALALVFGLVSIAEHSKLPHKFQILLEADMIMALVVLILFFTSLKVMKAFGARCLPSGMSIQVLDVLSLSDDQKAKWAAGINQGNGVRHIGAWDGAGAIEMMRSYSRRGVPDIGGIALHIRRPRGGQCTISHEPSAHDPDRDTVALVFLTMVEVIDLTRFVRPLACLCGRASLFKWLVVRFALIGFHWPFTTGVFLVDYTPQQATGRAFASASSSPRRLERKVALAMAVRATVEYNHSLPSDQRAALFLAPAMDTEPVSQVLESNITGFTSAALPHTAIVDLRPHKGKTWDQYLHSLKKGNRREFDKAFYAMGGSIHYLRDLGRFEEPVVHNDVFYHGKNKYDQVGLMRGSDDASIDAALAKYMEKDAVDDIGTVSETLEPTYPGWNNDFYDLWHRIAQNRIVNGDSPTLYDLTPQMFTDVAKMDVKNRAFMLLRLNGLAIGSSVLFRFPHSRMMTCDMQGLDHNKGRQAKAYFIMLYRSVRYALEQGYDFVDFGPTTLGPKTDAGATLFPCRIGLYATDPLLRIASRLCVSAFASHQADVSDPTATTASVAKVVAADEDLAEIVIEIEDKKPEAPPVIQSEEDIEVIMAMDPAQMTGSQKKRYNKEKKKRAQKAAKAKVASGKQEGGAGAVGAGEATETVVVVVDEV